MMVNSPTFYRKFIRSRLHPVPRTSPCFVGSAAKGRLLVFEVLIKLFNDEDGATAIEYGLIAALIAVAAVTIMGTVGSNLTSIFTTVASKL